MKKLLDFLVLPREITEFEARYLRRLNKIGLAFFALHVPAFALLAYLNGTGAGTAVVLTLAVLAGPAVGYLTIENPRTMSLFYGFTAMLMGGLLVHFGQGPVQIEMHFYFFALIAMLAVFGNPLVILVAALTVALHHLGLWLVLPASVFNYDAEMWVVAVHAAFVVLESVATCYIARSFFDNVIGLERIVRARTLELDARNGDMRLVLDHVAQGFVTIDKAAIMSTEKSAIVERWLGAAAKGQSFPDYLATSAPEAAAMFRMGWDQVIEDFLPLEVTLDQLPKRFSLGRAHYRLGYTPILADGALDKVLVVISDITADVDRERLELEQREVLEMFERVSRDRNGFLEFVDEADEQVAAVETDAYDDLVLLKRIIHTLKGNSMLMGLHSVADVCHEMETRIIDEHARPSEAQRLELGSRWRHLKKNLAALVGDGEKTTLEIDEAEYRAVLGAALRNEPHGVIAHRLAEWKLEPTARRLERVAEQARGIANRLNKGPITISLEDNALRLEPARWAPFWSAFVHVVRNAIDHGIESAEDRAAAGKLDEPRLAIATRVEDREFVIQFGDNGRGIDWDAVAARARSRGMPCKTSGELVDALYQDGISTVAQVSEFSGRGIGMGAVRSACQKRGGVMRVAKSDKSGTVIEFRFPLAEMPADPIRHVMVA